MPVSGMKGAFGWVGQAAQDDLPAAGEYNTGGMTWHKVISGDLGLADDQRPYENEVGGSYLPPGTYKASYWAQGRLAIRPRLAVNLSAANGLVPLLWAYAGSMANVPSTTLITAATLPAGVLGTATDVEDMTGIAGDALIFPGASGSVLFGADRGDGDDRYLTLRKLTPTRAGYIGETFHNSKVAAINLSTASTGPLGAELALVGCGGDSDQFDQYALEAFVGEPSAANGWDYASAKSVDTIPMAGGGYVKQGTLSGSELRGVRDLQISLGGGFTRPQDQTIVGQYAPMGFNLLTRQIGISFSYLWDNPDLYRQIKTGGIAGTTWSQAPYTSPFWTKYPDLAGANAIGFFAQTVDWMAQAVGLQGESQVVMRVSGIVRDAPGAKWGVWLAAADYSGVVWPS